MEQPIPAESDEFSSLARFTRFIRGTHREFYRLDINPSHVLSCFEYFKVFCILMPICAVWPRRVTLVCICACYYSAIAYCPTYVHQRDKNKLKLHQCGSH